MVRTRRESMLAKTQSPVENIREKVQTMERKRMVAPKSPRKQTALKQKAKAKRESKKFEKLISRMKENQTKAIDRNLPDAPIQPKSIFDQIHDPIKSGEAKRNLKPVVIVIDD